MFFTMRVDMDNAAFQEDAGEELASILERTARRIRETGYYVGHSETIFDTNGNDVGRSKVHHDNDSGDNDS